MTRPRLVVVGASGRVGRLLAFEWRNQVELDIVEQFRSGNGPDKLIWPDLANGAPLLDFSTRYGPPDALLVLAGVTKGGPEALAGNVEVARHAIRAARVAGVARVFLTSSSAVYGLDRGKAFSEDDALAPTNVYGASKVQMEAIQVEEGDPRVTRLRIGNVAGADTLMISARNASSAAPLALDRYPDGDGPRRSYINPSCFVGAITSLVTHPAPPEVVNFAAPTPVKMRDLLDAAGVPWVWKPCAEPRTQSLVLDVSRLAAIHPFTPQDSEPASMVAHLRDAPVIP